jgi:hypothetical protein
MSDLEAELLSAIQVLNACVWRNRVDLRTIEQWLKEFGTDGQPGAPGRMHALYLLSRFMYFGDEEVRALLRALYRDHYRSPTIAEIRRQAGDTRDQSVLRAGFQLALSRTRFLAMGNPSESGTHLLYHYRQENDLTSKLFISTHEIFDLTQQEPALADPSITRYIFIDDFCGSGIQGVRYSRALMQRIAEAARQAGVTPRIAYHVLVGTSKGLERVRREAKFDEIACVLELDETFRAFSETSRYFRNPPDGIDRESAQALAQLYGEQLSPDGALGFDDGQLMLGFVHNTPNNTLPIFWHPGHANRTWYPLFRRYYKLTNPVRVPRSE